MNEKVRAPNSDLAYVDYCKGMKYKEIAEKYGVTINTVKSWKTRYKWSKDDKKSVHTKNKKVCTQKSEKKKPAENEVESVIENSDLTDKQRLFCIYYTRCFNATKAYQKAYGVDYPTAVANAYRMMENDGIKKEIIRLKQNRFNRELLAESDIFQKYMDIAFSDITDYVKFGTEKVPVMTMYGPAQVKDPETGEKKTLMETVNVIHFKDSTEVDGTIVAEVKHGKNGSSIKLADRMKALQWLSDHMDMGTEEQRARIAQIRAQTDKLTGNNQEIEDLNDIESEIYGNE
ncbi:MAG: terminase small subunit [Lachnospiraceae bacterium]